MKSRSINLRLGDIIEAIELIQAEMDGVPVVRPAGNPDPFAARSHRISGG
jgi:hypothetical protein